MLTSCDTPHFYQENKSVDREWDREDALTFHFDIKDTLSRYDFYMLSRNNNEYPYSNLFLFTELTAPDQTVYTDTLEYFLAYRDGDWIGTGGSLKELYLMYRENVSLKDTGEYKLSVRHGMREDKLKGIAGLSLIMDKK